jgi:heptosyltransferase-3
VPNLDDPGVEIVTGALGDFFRSLEGVRAFVGLDSFGVHAAHAIGTPAIMLNGANIATVWTPPGARVLSNAAPPACYPCMNRPTCLRDDHPYSCIREIPVSSVMRELGNLGALG